MLQHKHLWDAIDTLAQLNGYSTSGLAKKAGLDPTIFNKSKRISTDGRERWPTTESIAKILNVANSSIGQFASLIHNNTITQDSLALPTTKLSALQASNSFISSTGHINPDLRFNSEQSTQIDSQSFMLKINSNLYTPDFKKGDTVIVTTNGGVRKKDLVVIALTNGDNIIVRIKKISIHMVETESINTDTLKTLSIPNKDILWLGRILYKAVV